MNKYHDNDYEIYDENTGENKIEECYEEIYHIDELIRYSDNCEDEFVKKINILWDVKFNMINYNNKNIHIDTDNFSFKKRFIELMKNSSYYKKLKSFRNKLEKRKCEVFDEIKWISKSDN